MKVPLFVHSCIWLVFVMAMGCSSAEKLHGARKLPGCAYVASAERRANIIEGLSQIEVGMTQEQVRAIMGPPDEAIVLMRQHGKWEHGPIYRKNGLSYRYVIEDVGYPGNWRNENVLLYFSTNGFLEEISGTQIDDAQSIPR